jgi:hypothetical protein
MHRADQGSVRRRDLGWRRGGACDLQRQRNGRVGRTAQQDLGGASRSSRRRTFRGTQPLVTGTSLPTDLSDDQTELHRRREEALDERNLVPGRQGLRPAKHRVELCARVAMTTASLPRSTPAGHCGTAGSLGARPTIGEIVFPVARMPIEIREDPPFTLERLHLEHGADGELALKDYEMLGGVGARSTLPLLPGARNAGRRLPCPMQPSLPARVRGGQRPPWTPTTI